MQGTQGGQYAVGDAMLPRIHADGDAFSGDGGGVPLRRRGRDGAFGARGAFARAGHGGGGRGARLGQGALFARLRKCRTRRVPRRKGRGIHPQSTGGVPCSRPSARAAENGEHLRAAGGGERLSFRPRRSRSGALRRAGIRICDGRRARDQTGRIALFRRIPSRARRRRTTNSRRTFWAISCSIPLRCS